MWEMSDVPSDIDLKGRKLYEALIALKPADLQEGEWATRAGLNRGFFTDLKKASGGAPRSDTLRKLLKFIGQTEADLYYAAGHSVASNTPVIRQADGGESVEIIRLDLSLPMGTGASVEDYVEEEPVAFDLGYVRAFTRTPPHRLRIARGVGDSMFPTLLNNDQVWIDSSQTNLNQADKIWAVSINGAAAIKRLRPLSGGRVLIVSDNPSIENYEVNADEVMIGGRVIRYSRDI